MKKRILTLQVLSIAMMFGLNAMDVPEKKQKAQDDELEFRSVINSNNPWKLGGWLLMSIRSGNIDRVRALLDAGADVNFTNRSSDGDTDIPLHWAALNGWTEIVRLLIDRGADVELCGEMLLKDAEKGYLARVQGLLNAGVRVNFANYYGETALFRAAIKGKQEIVHLLIARGADINHVAKSGQTALMGAADKDDSAMCKLLIDAMVKQQRDKNDIVREI